MINKILYFILEAVGSHWVSLHGKIFALGLSVWQLCGGQIGRERDLRQGDEVRGYCCGPGKKRWEPELSLASVMMLSS